MFYDIEWYEKKENDTKSIKRLVETVATVPLEMVKDTAAMRSKCSVLMDTVDHWLDLHTLAVKNVRVSAKKQNLIN